MKYFWIIALLVLCFVATACSDKDLAKVSAGLQAAGIAIEQIRADTVLYEKQGILPEPKAKQIRAICDAVAGGNTQARAVILKIKTLDPEARAQLANIISPIVAALAPENLAFLDEIQNDSVRQKLWTSFYAARTALAVLQIILIADSTP